MTGMSEDELKRLLESMRQENAAAHVETRRHFDVSSEGLKQDIGHVAEAVTQLDEKLDREIGELGEQMASGFSETQAMVKFSHAELDRRVRALEETHNTLEKLVTDLQARVGRLESTTH